MMISTSVVLLFFLMLLAPCLFAVIGSRTRDDEDYADASLLQPGADAMLAVSSEAALAQSVMPAGAGAEEHAASAALLDAATEAARAHELRALLLEAELAGRHAARTEHLERHEDLDDLRRLVAEAEAEAITAQVLAAQARAAALIAASRAANARANAAAEMAEQARQSAEEASRAASETRASYTRRQIAERAEAEAHTPGKVPDDPSMHYPRARVNRRAA